MPTLLMIRVLALLCVCCVCSGVVCGQETTAEEPLLVGVKAAEPFVIETESGFEGISIELWRRIAERENLAYAFEATTLEGLLEGVASGRYAAGVAATTVTADREAVMDFTHPFFNGGLAIAVPDEGSGLSVMGMLRKLVSPGFVTAVALLSVVLLGVGLFVWMAERRANPEQFGGSPIKGLGSGFWFSAVTMTTVGYGDKAPVSPLGRFFALVWMFASIIIISFFTGAIASAFTTSQLEGRVSGPKDLPRAEVGAVEGSAAEASLRERGVRAARYATVDEGLDALAAGELDAFVHDEPILLYRVQQAHAGNLHVLEATFEPQPYAIALPPGSPLRESINLGLLETITSDDWGEVVDRYLAGD
jgi:polar amino acid transport system substrate-binding protein